MQNTVKKQITVALVLVVLVVVYLLFSATEKHNDIQSPISKVAAPVVVPEDNDTQVDQASEHEQKTQDSTVISGSGQQLEPEIKEALNELVDTSHEGLVEEQTDNGVMVDLKGKFRTAPVATIDENGQVVVQDYTSAPGR